MAPKVRAKKTTSKVESSTRDFQPDVNDETRLLLGMLEGLVRMWRMQLCEESSPPECYPGDTPEELRANAARTRQGIATTLRRIFGMLEGFDEAWPDGKKAARVDGLLRMAAVDLAPGFYIREEGDYKADWEANIWLLRGHLVRAFPHAEDKLTDDLLRRAIAAQHNTGGRAGLEGRPSKSEATKELLGVLGVNVSADTIRQARRR